MLRSWISGMLGKYLGTSGITGYLPAVVKALENLGFPVGA
jgi:hypothetical protein